MTIVIGREGPRQDAVLRLLQMSEDYVAALYPAESNHILPLELLEKDDVSFFVARGDGNILGCCALVDQSDGTGEIKRMFVDPEARGRRIGKRLLEAVEAEAKKLGIAILRLETGIHQPEAIGLYQRSGYREISAFGSYHPDPLSLFMEKRLDTVSLSG